MIRTEGLRVLSFNVAKNYLLIDTLLNICTDKYDVIFIQEPAWQTIRQAPSTTNIDGDDVTGAPRHPVWVSMVRPPDNDGPPPGSWLMSLVDWPHYVPLCAVI